ncbi:hypothetical protein EDEG_02702 [Edhazardia aedis USNM 41457]|uniref:asparaginase n=1 Tax=Edhazardia aedis (strain USNM 41457) TaxID=1003232 RepID=J9DJW3_EDHAE|nr:hypothetical protein EDEG_02702 [Edhazardia aedis USNM 41457]|eukprot:EJW02910.1 hypothetical protein EDEG_02702 [Edhazardia aedis USNM 41457]
MTHSKILVIHCGGTLGMISTENGYTTKKNFLAELLKDNKILNDENAQINEIEVDSIRYCENTNCTGNCRIVTEAENKNAVSNRTRNEEAEEATETAEESGFQMPPKNIEESLDNDLVNMSIYLNEESKPFTSSDNATSKDKKKKNTCKRNVFNILLSSFKSNKFKNGNSAKKRNTNKKLKNTNDEKIGTQNEINEVVKNIISKENNVNNTNVIENQKIEEQNENNIIHPSKNIKVNFYESTINTRDENINPMPNNKDETSNAQQKKIFSEIDIAENYDEKIFVDINKKKKIDAVNHKFEVKSFVTTVLLRKKRIYYDLIELPEIIDSSVATMDDWLHCLKIIEKNYNEYRGFVLIHGTDTMAYATSFFSTMTKNLSKPIVFTGAMVPMSVENSESEGNLVNALMVANFISRGGVYLVFAGYVHNGNKVTKFSSTSIDAFYSKNRITLMEAIANKNISMQKPTIFNHNFNKNVAVLKLFPGMTSKMIRSILEETDGIVLETFGSGNGICQGSELLVLLEEYIKKGKTIVNISQCLDGYVNSSYEANSALARIGVLCGYDSTTEMAFCKLARNLAKNRVLP